MGKLASNSREDTRLLLVHVRVFSRDILKGGRGILECEPVVRGSWGCIIFWKI